MIILATAIVMAVIWGAVSGSVSAHNLFFGFVLSLLTLGLFRDQITGPGSSSRVLRILSLVWLFLVELAKSAWRVAVLVTRPQLNIAPGIFAFPLTVTRDFEITLLANLITLTPGTLSVDVSEDRKTLFVHALDCSDAEALKKDIAEGFERKILEAFA